MRTMVIWKQKTTQCCQARRHKELHGRKTVMLQIYQSVCYQRWQGTRVLKSYKTWTTVNLRTRHFELILSISITWRGLRLSTGYRNNSEGKLPVWISSVLGEVCNSTDLSSLILANLELLPTPQTKNSNTLFLALLQINEDQIGLFWNSI